MDGIDSEEIPPALREVLSKRVIDDLKIKIEKIKKTPIDDVVKTFFELVEFGIESYVKSEQQRFPDKTPKEIMRDYYLSQKRKIIRD